MIFSGVGFSGMYTSSTWTNLANFNHTSHGRVIGTFQAIFFLSVTASGIIYQQVFSPNLGRYFLAVGITSGTVNLIAIFFLKKISVEISYEPIEFMGVAEETSNVINLKELDDKRGLLTKLLFWFKVDFQLLMWINAIDMSISHVIIVMFSTYTESLDLVSYITPLISATPFIASSLLFLMGYISDLTLSVFPPLNIAIVLNIIFNMTLIFCIPLLDKIAILVILTIATSGAAIIPNVIIPPELHKQFGENKFGTCTAVVNTVAGILLLLIQYVDSLFYDKELQKQSGTNNANVCKGKDCFTYAFILHSVLVFVAMCCNVMYFYRQRNKC